MRVKVFLYGTFVSTESIVLPFSVLKQKDQYDAFFYCFLPIMEMFNVNKYIHVGIFLSNLLQ